jgi:hypothetical protein
MSLRERLIQMRGSPFPTVYHMENIDEPLASPDLRPATAIYKTAPQSYQHHFRRRPALYNRETGEVDENLCRNCRSHGVFEFINGNKYCISGCSNCVSHHFHLWGSLGRCDVPCNGSYMGRELSNLELIYRDMVLRTRQNPHRKSFTGLFQDVPNRIHYLMEILWENIDINYDENWATAMLVLQNELSQSFLNMVKENSFVALMSSSVPPCLVVDTVKTVKWYISFFERRTEQERLTMANYSWDPREDPVPKLPKKLLCRKLMDVVEDNLGKLTDGDYLKMMNLLRDIHLTQC